MNAVTDANSRLCARQLAPLRWLTIVLVAWLGTAGGCNRLRLPAIDPTGSCLFSPLPTTTTLALPGSAGESCGCLSCLHHLGSCLKVPDFTLPEPAFPQPTPPPKCATPQPPATAPGCHRHGEPCVPSAPCNGSCQNGPPAVLLGEECKMKDLLHLPKRGKRGCILLSPQKIIAPVGGEVVLKSGICGTDGYLQTNQPLEWMLTPESVGTFIQVGDDDPGLLHRLVGANQSKKLDASYAHGVTSSKRTLITRGNLDSRDDVQLESGQTWITISSPSEGTSRVTVLAPESECWDQRKATATIYWIDARWQFPGPQRVPAGTPVDLTTRVTRSEGAFPATGWKVRYEVLQPELASFAGTDGSSVVEVEVNDSGNAVAQLIPHEQTSGTATVAMEVIRPGGESDNLPTLTLGSGQTFVTWTAPQLALRAGAPTTATFNEPFEVVANVSNPGNQPAQDVRVEVAIPPGTGATSPDPFAQVLPNAVVWEIGTIPPQTQLDLFMNVTAEAPVQLNIQARGAGGLFAEDRVRVDIFRPSLSISVTPRTDRVQAGQSVMFDIGVTNTGDRPLSNVRLTAVGEDEMQHAETGSQRIGSDKTGGPLQPGQTWTSTVSFIPLSAGRRCITVEATAEGEQRANSEACVTAINPPPPTPAVSATIEARDQIATGETVLVRGRVINSGEVLLRQVRVTLTYDPQLELLQATEGADASRTGQYLLSWTLAELPPSESTVLEAEFRGAAANPRSLLILTAESAEGARGTAETEIEIQQSPASAPPAQPPPQLPPATEAPEIPGGGGGAGNAGGNGNTGGAAPIPSPGRPAQGNGPIAPQLPGNQPPAAPSGGEAPGQLQLSLSQQDTSPGVDEPIRYALSVTNDREQMDGAVSIRFRLPPGVSIQSISPTTSPELGEYKRFDDTVILESIRAMRPGETVHYEIVLTSNQPQTFTLAIEALSRLEPDGASDRTTTEVL